MRIHPETRLARILEMMDAKVVTAADMARAFGVSERTIHRDVAILRARGRNVLGDPGYGFTLGPERAAHQRARLAHEVDRFRGAVAVICGVDVAAVALQLDPAAAAKVKACGSVAGMVLMENENG